MKRLKRIWMLLVLAHRERELRARLDRLYQWKEELPRQLLATENELGEVIRQRVFTQLALPPVSRAP